jgi:hypothetical protein
MSRKVKKVVPYNERERNEKVVNFILEISSLKMDHILTQEIRKKFDDFTKYGTEYVDCIDLPQYSRQMIISLKNDKHQKPFINLKYVSPDDKKI